MAPVEYFFSSLNKLPKIIDSQNFIKQDQFFKNKIELNKLSPIPIVRRSVPNTPSVRRKLAINGYKYFSKLTASGQDTGLVLKNIKQSCTLKYIRSFEFDPYLCEESYLKELSFCFKKLRNTKTLSIFFRRATNENEIDCLLPFFYKLLRIKKLKLDILGSSILNTKWLVKIVKAMQKSPFYTSLDFSSKGIEGNLFEVNRQYFKLMTRLLFLEELCKSFSAERVTSRIGNESKISLKKLNLPKLKKIRTKCNLTSEW